MRFAAYLIQWNVHRGQDEPKTSLKCSIPLSPGKYVALQIGKNQETT